MPSSCIAIFPHLPALRNSARAPWLTIFLSPPRAYILCVFTQGGINPFVRFLAISGPPWIFKALMFGCLMHLPKQLAITGLREILPARFSPVFCSVSGSRKEKIKNKVSVWSLSSLTPGKVFSVDNDLFQFTRRPKDWCICRPLFFFFFYPQKAWVPANVVTWV